jgi:hypothetical protein
MDGHYIGDIGLHPPFLFRDAHAPIEKINIFSFLGVIAGQPRSCEFIALPHLPTDSYQKNIFKSIQWILEPNARPEIGKTGRNRVARKILWRHWRDLWISGSLNAAAVAGRGNRHVDQDSL